MENLAIAHMDLTIFKNRKILLTGHTGFKGAWLAIWLEQLGADIAGIGLDPDPADGLFTRSGIGARIRDYRADIRDLPRIQEILTAEQPEIVFHLAAQALVLESYRTPAETFATNTQGTVNLLEAIRHTPSVLAAIMVTTDKCYENREWVHGYRETDPMGGHDPYSASKGAAEIAIAAYRRSFFNQSGSAAIASARSGNVIGGGDWSANRLVPDIIRAIENNAVLDIRYPDAVRPWQHVLEPLGGYLALAEALLRSPRQFADAWNFGPLPGTVIPVRQIADAFFQWYGRGNWRDASEPGQLHEAGLLTLDINKAMHQLHWRPVLDFRQMIDLTADWYQRSGHENALDLCQKQIHQYQHLWTLQQEN